MGKDEYTEQLNNSGNSEQKDIIELLLNPEKINLATDLNEDEIVILSMLEIFAEKPFSSAEGLKDIRLNVIEGFVNYFKINRISKNRLSREELIKGIVSFNSNEDKGLKDRIGGFFNNMF